MNTIDLFMWRYQHLFQISSENAAQAIFQKLDPKLNTKVFLVGVLVEERDDRHPICLEPEDCGFDVTQFEEVKEQAIHLEASDEERHILHSHPIAQENHDRRLEIRALQKAVEQAVKRHDEYKDVVSFCSWPALVEGYRVIVVLQFSRDTFLSHYSLTDVSWGRFPLATSLLDASVGEFLNLCFDALKKPAPGAGLNVIGRDYDEVIRSAGKNFMRTPAYKGGNLDGFYGLFEACNTISSLRYEGEDGVGRMLIARKEHPNIEVILELSDPVLLQDYRAVRKLLEVSSDDMSLLCDSAYIYGYGKSVGIYDRRSEDLFLVRFTKHYSWEVLHDQHVLMKVQYGQPELPTEKIDKLKFEIDIKRIFSGVNDKDVKRLWEIIVEATKQKHGTMVVVSSGAKDEAKRLQKQATIIEPVKLTPSLMGVITAIDGAVLIDTNSTCYAIGVILDGLASQKGTPARGARYNSAIRYAESSEYPCIMVVISEDGSIELIPDLMPQISRSTIISAINALKELKEKKEFDPKIFNRTMGWLGKHRFYLSAEMCSEINELRHAIEENRNQEGGTSVSIVYSDFVPNEEMNDSYFLDEG